MAVRPLSLLVREGGGQSDITVGRLAREDVHFVWAFGQPPAEQKH